MMCSVLSCLSIFSRKIIVYEVKLVMQCGLIVVSIKVNGAQSDGTPTNKNDSEII